MDRERHVAGLEGEDSVILRCHIVEELFAAFHGAFRRSGLLRGKLAECWEKPTVYTTGKEKEYTANLLNEFLPCLVERGRIIVGPGKLLRGSVVGLDMWVRLVLWFSWGGMLETCEGFGDVVWR